MRTGITTSNKTPNYSEPTHDERKSTTPPALRQPAIVSAKPRTDQDSGSGHATAANAGSSHRAPRSIATTAQRNSTGPNQTERTPPASIGKQRPTGPAGAVNTAQQATAATEVTVPTSPAISKAQRFAALSQKMQASQLVMSSIADSMPPPSQALNNALALQFADAARYAPLDTTLGQDWRSHISIGLVKTDTPDVPGSQYEIYHVSPENGRVTVPAALNDAATKRELDRDFGRHLIQSYSAEQEAFWKEDIDGTERINTFKQALRNALEAEAETRHRGGTLSDSAYALTAAAMETAPTDDTAGAAMGPDTPGGGKADISRLTVDDENVPGAFVFTRQGADAAEDTAVLWRPGRPLQEFSSVQALRTWVANELRSSTTATADANSDVVGTTQANGSLFDLRANDLIEQRQSAVEAAFREYEGVSALAPYLDRITDASAYLDLSRAENGNDTEATRTAASGPSTPAQMIDYEQAVQDEWDSAFNLRQLTSAIPSLREFTSAKIAQKIAKDFPEAAATDLDRATVLNRTKTTTYVRGITSGTTSFKTEEGGNLIDHVIRNTPEWRAPKGNGKVEITTHSAPLFDREGNALFNTKGQRMILNDAYIKNLIATLDVGKAYPDLLETTFSSQPVPGQDNDLKTRWMASDSATLHADRLASAIDPEAAGTFRWQSAASPSDVRGRAYIDAVLDHPDPATRPLVDKHRIVANTLRLGATTETQQGGQTINGVMVIGTASPQASPAVVLYTPDAPDNVAFRELASIDDVQHLSRKPEWKHYFSERMATADDAEVARILDDRAPTAGVVAISPIEGNLYEDRYNAAAAFTIAQSRHRAPSNSQIENRSTFNKAMLGADIVMSLAPGGTAARAGSAARRTASSLARKVGSATTLRKAANALPGPQTPRIPTTTTAGWQLNDPAVRNRLTPGSRGRDGVTFQRDPVTAKEYMKVGDDCRRRHRR